MRWQHCTGVHSIVTGAYVLPTHGTKDINESLIPRGLWSTHVAHLAHKVVVIAQSLPFGHLINVVEGFSYVVEITIFVVPKYRNVIVGGLRQNFQFGLGWFK